MSRNLLDLQIQRIFDEDVSLVFSQQTTPGDYQLELTFDRLNQTLVLVQTVIRHIQSKVRMIQVSKQSVLLSLSSSFQHK